MKKQQNTFIKFILSFFMAQFAYSQAKELPQNWQNLDFGKDGIHGVSTEKAYNELLKGKKSKKIIVAVIDSGVDIGHEDLKDNIWTNPSEIPANGIDDDKNGYIDDMNGWDFLGNKNGQDLKDETLEVTREVARLTQKMLKMGKDSTKDVEFEYYQKVKGIYTQEQQENFQYLTAYRLISTDIESATALLKEKTKLKEITEESIKDLVSDDKKVMEAKAMLAYYFSKGITIEKIKDGLNDLAGKENYGFNLNFDGRKIIGDNPTVFKENNYGNAEVQGPDALHGTHVAGIIAANRNNNLGILGIADNVQIMVIRAVPNGDERDKDIVNAIKYAVNNGAKIINMSFGKSLSPNKTEVDEAVLYAQSKGVLMIHAAGNDNKNVDLGDNFPNAKLKNSEQTLDNWIEVGANAPFDDASLPASFSNFGKKTVTLFAPGTSILSTTPNGKYLEEDGTSMAAPVVSGVAALVWSYFPELSYLQLKEILMKSVAIPSNIDRTLPGTEDKINFSELSVTGGIVNAYNAIILASQQSKMIK